MSILCCFLSSVIDICLLDVERELPLFSFIVKHSFLLISELQLSLSISIFSYLTQGLNS
jgi:hypothetical protein